MTNSEPLRRYQVRELTDEERSHVLAVIKIARFKPAAKLCFKQSQQALLADESGRLTYVEGRADSVPHAWLAFEDGAVVDITRGQLGPVRLSAEDRRRYEARYGAWNGRGAAMASEYLGRPFTREAVIASVLRGHWESLDERTMM